MIFLKSSRSIRSLDIRALGNIKLINTFSYYAAIAAFVYAVIYYFANIDNLWLFCIGFSLALLVAPLLNYLSFFETSKAYFILLITFICLSLSCIMGRGAYMQFGLILPIGLSFIFYNSRRRVYRIIFMVLAIIAFMVLEFSNYSIFKEIPINEDLLYYTRIGIGLTLLLILALILKIFTKHIELAEAKQEKWLDIFENSEWGVVVGSSDGNYMEMMNPAYERMHGYQANELKDKPISEMFAPEFREYVPAHIALSHESGHHVFESVHIRKDGSRFPVMVDVTAVKNEKGEVLYRAINVQDISDRKKALENIKESNRRYRDLFENSPVALWEEDATELISYFEVLKEKGVEDFGAYLTNNPEELSNCSQKIKVNDVNQQTLNLFKAKSKSELLENIGVVFTQRSFMDFAHLLTHIYIGALEFEYETEYTTVIGDLIEVSFKSYIHKNIKGQPDYSRVQIAMEDITARKQAERALKENEEQFRAIFEQAAVGVVQIKWESGEFVKANQKYLDILGYSREELFKLTFKDITHPDDLGKDFGYKRLLKSGEIADYNLEKRYINKNGSIVWVMISVAPLSKQKKTLHYLIAVVEDITERKKAQEALERSEMKLKEVNATKDRFFSVLAHDLKNPFNIIQGFAKRLNTEYDKLEDDKRKKYIGEIAKSTRSTYKLLENLLIWSSSQQGRIEIKKENLHLNELIQTSVDPYLLFAENKNIRIENQVDVNIMLQSDKYTLSTVIGNLVNNAVKFTSEGGEVVISAQQIKHFTEIYVRDNGIGMSPNQVGQLFKIDKNQSKPGTDNEQGSGLGLIICKEFVEKNGGNIRVESEPGKGSLFIVALPDNK